MHSISPREAEKMAKESKAVFIDTREPDEFKNAYIEGSHLYPMSVLKNLPTIKGDGPLVFFCQSGGRTERLVKDLEEWAGGPEVYIIKGGLDAWAKDGLPIKVMESRLSLFRQIQIGAGSAVLLGLLLGLINSNFLWISAFVGCGLIFAGITGFCGMGLLLARMPWNK